MATDPTTPPAPVTMFQVAAVGSLSGAQKRQLQAEIKKLCREYGLTLFSQFFHADD